MSYEIVIRDSRMNEIHRSTTEDRELTGRQLIELAVGPDEIVAAYLILALGPDSQLEDIDLEEVHDLSSGHEFFLFRDERSFNFMLNQRRQVWCDSKIEVGVLYYLAGLGDNDQRILFQERRNMEDLPLKPGETVSLEGKGLEIFYVGPGATTAGLCDVLPEMDQRYLRDHRQLNSTSVTDRNGQTGIVFEGFALPDQKFDHQQADVLVVLPSSYPDTGPDMFFCDPWIRLSSTGALPRAADQEYLFAERQWQRWSRHNTEPWDPTVHGIHTVIQRVRDALLDTA